MTIHFHSLTTFSLRLEKSLAVPAGSRDLGFEDYFNCGLIGTFVQALTPLCSSLER